MLLVTVIAAGALLGSFILLLSIQASLATSYS